MEKMLEFQKTELTEYHVYKNLARITDNNKNKKTLETISQDELDHYRFWKNQTNKEVKPDSLRVFFYTLTGRLLGLTFATKLMETAEKDAQQAYSQVVGEVPGVRELIKDETEHEAETLSYMEDQFVNYVGSIVLGLNDALIELTGALAGLTLAFQDSRLIALAGFVTGIAASLSMAASEYQSTKAELKSGKNAVKAAVYTGLVYLAVVILLVTPFIIFSNAYHSLALTLAVGILIISFFSFYVSIAQKKNFRKQFTEMAILSLGVAAISFTIGYFLRLILGIEA